MAKKKTNPHNKPIDPKMVDIDELMRQATDDNVLHGWLLFFGSLSYYYDTTTERILRIWEMVNQYSSTFARQKDIDRDLKLVDEILGVSMPYPHIVPDIKTEGQLKSFKRKLQKNALYAAFSLIAYPMIVQEVLPVDIIKEVFKRAYELLDEIIERRISYRDLQEVLVDEYGILLHSNEKGVFLKEVSPDFKFSD